MVFLGKNSKTPLKKTRRRYEMLRFLEAPDLRFALAAPSFPLLGLERRIIPWEGKMWNHSSNRHWSYEYIYIYVYIYIYIYSYMNHVSNHILGAWDILRLLELSQRWWFHSLAVILTFFREDQQILKPKKQTLHLEDVRLLLCLSRLRVPGQMENV